MKSCLICDDHAMMREAIAGAVRYGWPEAEITQAGDYHAAWAAMASLKPDLCICDLVMPGSTSVAGISRLRDASPDTPILVVTGNEDDETLLALLELGIAGFAPKTSKSALIEAAIQLVRAGGRYLPPRLIAIAGRRGGSATTARLTDRQRDVLGRIATGKTNKEIARDLNLSPATVKAYTSAAILALGASNRIDAANRAREKGLLESEDMDDF
jgi:two-component system, NarL family, nitrate/nitrite response regulator NarL